MLGGSIHTTKKNTEALLVVSKESGLEVNADETKRMVMSGDRNITTYQNKISRVNKLRIN